MSLRQRRHLTYCFRPEDRVIEVVRSAGLAVVEQIGSGETVLRAEHVIHFGRDVILVCHLAAHEAEESGISIDGAVWQRVEAQIWLHTRADCHVAGHQMSLPGSGGQDGVDQRLAEPLAQSLIVGKNESAALDDRPASRATELISLERRNG